MAPPKRDGAEWPTSSSEPVARRLEVRQPFVKPERRGPLKTRGDVRVGVQRDSDGRMTEALLDDLRVNALAQHERRVRVAEVVQPQLYAQARGDPHQLSRDA